MKRKKGKSKKGTIVILIGLLLLAAALSLVAYNFWDSGRAGSASEETARKLDTYINAMEPSDDNDNTEDKNKSMPTVVIDGQTYIGELEIPSISRKLPVMADWSYEKLRISPCRYSGSYYADDLVILGHNYGRHFSPIKWIDIGADVYFTNVNGERIHYIVENRETIAPTDVEEMIENDENSEKKADWDLTLFTCTTGGRARCAVRCVRA